MIMKKFAIFILAASLIHSDIVAQVGYGFRAGVNMANWKGDAASSLKDIVSVTNGAVVTTGRTGFHAGAYLSVPAGDIISIEPAVMFSQKGFTINGDLEVKALNFLGAGARVQVQSSYIDIPVLIRARITEGLSVYGGPQVSYLVKNNLHTDVNALGFSLVRKDLDITNQFNRLDMGLSAGLGYKLPNGLNLNAGYDFGLSRVDRNSRFRSFNRVVKVSVGFQL